MLLSVHPPVTASTPLKVTLPSEVPNPFPFKVSGVPTGPESHGPESHIIPTISTRMYRFGRLLETWRPGSATFTTTGPLNRLGYHCHDTRVTPTDSAYARPRQRGSSHSNCAESNSCAEARSLNGQCGPNRCSIRLNTVDQESADCGRRSLCSSNTAVNHQNHRNEHWLAKSHNPFECRSSVVPAVRDEAVSIHVFLCTAHE